jgi:hypothetical protein
LRPSGSLERRIDVQNEKNLMPLLAAFKSSAIALLVTIALAGAAQAASNSCAAAARHLVDLVKKDWPSSDQNIPGSASNMIAMVSHKPSPGFVPGAVRFKLADYSRQAFLQQAKRTAKPFTPSGELLKALDDMQGAVTFFELPGTDLLAANTIGGTADCNSTVFFSVRGGHANLVQAPEQWENDVGGSCGLSRSFASVDGVPVIIDDSLDAGPSLASTLTLTPRDGGKWRKPCTASFVFAPHFDLAKTWNDWPSLNNWEANDCGPGGCERLQRAALDLVKLTQQDRLGVEAHLLAAMTRAQREEYQRLKRAADGADSAEAPADGEDATKPKTAANLTDTNPLRLPLLVDDRVLVGSVGHNTIGWRMFADWKVAIEAADGDKVREIARFAIGMTQGPIAGVAIK